jgi:hypothetical protein
MLPGRGGPSVGSLTSVEAMSGEDHVTLLTGAGFAMPWIGLFVTYVSFLLFVIVCCVPRADAAGGSLTSRQARGQRPHAPLRAHTV